MLSKDRPGAARLVPPLMFFALVAAIAFAIRYGWTARIDRMLLLGLAPSPAMAWVAHALTIMGNTASRIAITASVAVVLLVKRCWRQAVALVALVSLGAALNSGIKLIVMRPRPALLPHLDPVTTASFPSGHAANGMMMYLSLALLVPARWRMAAVIGAIAMVLAIGVSRVMLAVHWPSDVLAGWCLGLGWVLLWRNFLVCPARG